MEELFEINQTQKVLKREDFLDNCMNRNKWIKLYSNHQIVKIQ